MILWERSWAMGPKSGKRIQSWKRSFWVKLVDQVIAQFVARWFCNHGAAICPDIASFQAGEESLKFIEFTGKEADIIN